MEDDLHGRFPEGKWRRIVRIDLSLLTVQRMIFHEIPLPSPTEQLELTEVETDADDDLKEFVRRRFIEALNKHGFEIAFDPDLNRTTHDAVNALLMENPTCFLESSWDLARQLHSAQTRTVSPGLLMVATTMNGSLPGTAVIKIERDEGLSLNSTIADGRKSFSVEHLKNLMFTDKTRLYKLGYFQVDPSNDGTPIGVHADLQRTWSTRNQTASEFFLRRFLGCRPTETPAVTNKRYFEAGVSFINTVDDPERRGKYLMNFQSDIQSHRGTINPNEFIVNYVDRADQQPFADYFSAQDINPSQTFVKDTTLIRNQIRKARWDFESGIILMGTQDAFDAHVETEPLLDGELRTTITDRLKQVSGK